MICVRLIIIEYQYFSLPFFTIVTLLGDILRATFHMRSSGYILCEKQEMFISILVFPGTN